MYSRRRINERIEALSEKTSWLPEYHVQSEIDSFNKHVQSLQEFDAKGNQHQKREFNHDELKWIENEFNLCASDYQYWSANYAYINAKGDITRFKRRYSQEMLLQLWGEREEAGLGIEQIVLKARQQGISTEVELAITHRVNFGFGVIAAVASSETDQAERMSGMMTLAYNEMPYWMQAPPTSNRAGSLFAFAGNNTRLSIYTGRAVAGLARGDTPTVIHLSEVSDWPNPKALIENSLFKAVHPSPRVFMVLESTGNGNVGWFPDQWNWATENFESGGSRLQPVFFPWFLAIDLFPTETWLREHPVPPNFVILPETERMMDKCAAYVHMTPMMRRFLGDSWQLPTHQAWFWQMNYLEHGAKHNKKGWLQEMCCDDVEALQPKKDLVFDSDSIESQWTNREPYTVWSIVGEQILEKHHPIDAEVDFDTERFRVSFPGVVHTVAGKEDKDLVWEFIPLNNPSNPFDRNWSSDCKVLIFRWPEEGYDYSIGVDTAAGGSGDDTCICVNRRSPTGREPDCQVAEFASNQVSSAEAHAYVLALCALYSAEGCGGYPEPLVAVEQVRGPGDNVQLQMKMHGYRRFYQFARMDGKNPKHDKQKSHKQGWYTWTWSRQFMLDIYKHAVENGWYKLNSPYLLRSEIPSFEIDQTATGKVRYDHASGKMDNRIFGSAIAYIIVNDTESMSKRVERKFERDDERLPQINMEMPQSLGVMYSQIAEDFHEVMRP
jgi:hypothetical protein